MAEPGGTVDMEYAVTVILFGELDMKCVLTVADFIKFTAFYKIVPD